MSERIVGSGGAKCCVSVLVHRLMRFIVTLLVIVAPLTLVAQRPDKHQPIDSVGWDLPNLTELSIFNSPDDAGEATFLLVVNPSGRITKIKTLSNTFPAARELDLKAELKSMKLIRKTDWKGKTGYKGVLQISAASCADERNAK